MVLSVNTLTIKKKYMEIKMDAGQDMSGLEEVGEVDIA